MSSADKFGIIFAIAVTAVAVAFTATGGLGIESDMSTRTDKVIIPALGSDPEIRAAQKASEEIQQLTKKIEQEIEQKTEKAKEIAKEAVGAKLPAKFVSIPRGTSLPGCEKPNLCYDPPHVTIFVGGEIIWRNNDSSAHTVTSGIVLTGPDGNFNSGLMKSDQAFSVMFEESGDFPYFCMIHPWATGLVTVS